MAGKFVSLVLGICVAAEAQTVVCPNSRANTEGNDGNSYPFSAPQITRYQQAFGPGSLTAIAGRQITQIAFRLDSFHTSPYPAGFQYPQMVIRLSTTSRLPDAMLLTMDGNVGADVRTVHSGAYTLPALSAGPTPRPFDMVIDLEQPFLYEGGTLVMDIDGGLGPSQSSGDTFYLDGESTVGDAVARVYQLGPGNEFFDSRGLVARFTAVTAQCYANCDGSTTAPILNVQDFVCFLNQFAAGDSRANCDGSTTSPVLNVLDFNCFLNRFGAGC